MPPRKKKAAPATAGIDVAAVAGGTPPAEISKLAARIDKEGGATLARYREPYGGHWVALAVLPIDKVHATPYQRDLSKTHAEKLTAVIAKLGRFLDPVIAFPDDELGFIVPNGMHRLNAMRSLGAQAITALVVPEPEIAFRILALNTEKAHNLRDKALEVVRMTRALAAAPATAKKSEQDYAFELEQPSYITLGMCYEQNGRFAGGAYNSVVSRCDEFADAPLAKTVPERERKAAKLLELDAAVGEAVKRLKAAGLTSPYLKAFVVARANPLRFVKAAKPGEKAPKADFDKTIDKMLASVAKLDAAKIKPSDLASAAAMAAAAGGAEE